MDQNAQRMIDDPPLPLYRASARRAAQQPMGSSFAVLAAPGASQRADEVEAVSVKNCKAKGTRNEHRSIALLEAEGV